MKEILKRIINKPITVTSMREAYAHTDEASLKIAAIKALVMYYNLKYTSSNGDVNE